MKHSHKTIGLALAIATTSIATVSQAEPHPGKAFHDQANCMKCHASQPYNPQKTKDYPQLVKMVQYCNDNLNAGLWEEEIEQLADYLNEEYYHHPK
jgi:cytochrome c553